jgi:hypothetical protein
MLYKATATVTYTVVVEVQVEDENLLAPEARQRLTRKALKKAQGKAGTPKVKLSGLSGRPVDSDDPGEL